MPLESLELTDSLALDDFFVSLEPLRLQKLHLCGDMHESLTFEGIAQLTSLSSLTIDLDDFKGLLQDVSPLSGAADRSKRAA